MSRPASIIYATLAMIAFAGNSVLCRIALKQGAIDPASFSTIRFMAGAVTLLLVMVVTERAHLRLRGSFTSAIVLAVYAVPFSFAYTSLSAGTGALILFGTVQITMLIAALQFGEAVRPVQWMGLGVALAGMVYLVSPSLATPEVVPAVLMIVAGVCWGVYSWRGRGAANPLASTAGNFVLAVPLLVLVSLFAWPRTHLEPSGVALSVASGAIASGLGYVAWYAALRALSGMQAAVIQLAVPVLAAVGGVVFLAEAISIRLIFSTLLVLGGIAVAVVGRG